MLLEKLLKVFCKPSEIRLILSRKNVKQNMTPGREKALTLQKAVQILKKIPNVNPSKILGKVTKFYEMWMIY